MLQDMEKLVVMMLVGLLVVLSRPLKLEQASVLFRHGDRSPTHTYPKDPYQESFWPQGFGQLSTEGMRQEHNLGEILRSRYVDDMKLLHPNYTRVQVYVRSTDYDRTLMSAECVLAGLFPPKEDQMFNASLPWQPIPVHTVAVEDDIILQTYSNCPAYAKLLEEDTKKPAYINLNKEYKEFFHSLEINTGYESLNLTNAHSVYGVLNVEAIRNLTLPEWVNATVMSHLLNLTLYTSQLRFNSVKKNQLTAGNWVEKVVSDMNAFVNGTDSEVKLYIYSAHDTTVEAMMTALGVFNGILPPYAATFIIELYSTDNKNDYRVSMFYRNETNGTHLWPLHVEACLNTTLCTLQEFIQLTDHVIPSNWEKECGLNSESSPRMPSITVLQAVMLAVLLGPVVLLLLAIAANCVQISRRRNEHHYVGINSNTKDT